MIKILKENKVGTAIKAVKIGASFAGKSKIIYGGMIIIMAVGIPLNYFLLKDSPDNLLEEAEENILHQTFGISMDLSPMTPENDRE